MSSLASRELKLFYLSMSNTPTAPDSPRVLQLTRNEAALWEITWVLFHNVGQGHLEQESDLGKVTVYDRLSQVAQGRKKGF